MRGVGDEQLHVGMVVFGLEHTATVVASLRSLQRHASCSLSLHLVTDSRASEQLRTVLPPVVLDRVEWHVATSDNVRAVQALLKEVRMQFPLASMIRAMP